MTEPLYRSRTDRVIAGVAGGIAAAWDIDPSLVRVAWVVLAFVTQGLAVLVYVVMVFVVPEPPAGGPEPAPFRSVTDGDDPGPPGTGRSTAPAGVASSDRRDADAPAAGGSARQGAQAPPNLALVFGLFMILLGAWFLLRPLLPQLDFDVTWPVAAIGLGVILVVMSVVTKGAR